MMKLTTVILASASLATRALAAQCNADNCLRAAVGTARGLQSARLSACTSFAQCTVTPGASYLYDSTAPTGTRISSSAIVSCPTAVPSSASACSGVDRYSSACSCGGVTATYSAAPTPTIRTPSNYFRLIIENAASSASGPVSPGAYVAFGATGGAQGQGVVLIQSPAGSDPFGSGYFQFSSNETADPTFALDVVQHRSGALAPLSDGDALWAYTTTCASRGGCAGVRCQRVPGPNAASNPDTKYMTCVSGANTAWTQMYLCPEDDSAGQEWDYLFLAQPGGIHPGCAAVNLRMEQLPGNPYFNDARRKRDGFAVSTWNRQTLFTKYS